MERKPHILTAVEYFKNHEIQSKGNRCVFKIKQKITQIHAPYKKLFLFRVTQCI